MNATFDGMPAAPGIGIGKVELFHPFMAAPNPATLPAYAGPEGEWQRFLEAQAQVDAELEDLARNQSSLIAEIFAVHRVILHDKALVDAVRVRIFDGSEAAIVAVQTAIAELGDIFLSFEDDYFAGRASDILDLGQRLLEHLGASITSPDLRELGPDTILVAEDLRPSDLALLIPANVLGIALAHSTPTAHSAILARSLGIPLVCALNPTILRVEPGALAIVDGTKGRLLIRPEPAVLAGYERLRDAGLDRQARAIARAGQPAIMRSGAQVPVLANANSPEDVAQSVFAGADGIGLLRTEYLFRNRTTPPTLDEQAEIYTRCLRQVRGQLTVRALDAGGDKPVAYIDHRPEDNPFLGLRGMRLLIEQPELLYVQHDALATAQLAAGDDIEVRLLLPMITTLEEVRTALRLLAESEVPARPKLGIMIEVPSAALIARALAPLVDFFSIGTNDLAQYTLASDRTNHMVARMADPLHPAVLHLIKLTCDAAQGKPVALCGEIAGDPAAVPLLLGLGVTELSAPLPAVPLVKETVRDCDMAECRRLAEAALACATVLEVRGLLTQGS